MFLNISKNSIALLFSLGLVLLMTHSVNAQSSRNSDYEPKTFRESVFLGGYINSPFFAANNQFSQFQVGLAPFAGYKFNEYISAGPLFKVNYTYLLSNNINGPSKVSLWDLSASAFVRATFFQRFFLQGEGGIYSIGLASSSLIKSRESFPIAFLGAGYSWDGNQFRQEIMLAFELTNNFINYGMIPFDYRIGFRFFFD